MDGKTAQALYDYLATTAVCLPPAPLPRLFPTTFTPEQDSRIVADGFSRARELLATKKKDTEARYVLTQLAKAASPETEGALDVQTVSQIVATLKAQPVVLKRVPLDARHIRKYAAKCWGVFEAIVDVTKDDEEADRIIRCSIAQPMSVVEHNLLAQLLIDRMPRVSTETLFAYLNAVEASCRTQPAGGAQVHNVRLASKVFNSALDTNSSLAETMSIELSSFCLSYSQIKDATDLYRRIISANS
ncbi:hypothetical protein H4R20_002294 [Coemansia guatemalensis]|uniref:CCR4-NOT transcription complex subunit 11 n=1 Tax=Coemansia guatemalensis TaxID=2761395 RepID=A0A9W8HVR4_9FUNG|nr:hypothetical protein H4R20_002294 [Coemansia guatemalensis]